MKHNAWLVLLACSALTNCGAPDAPRDLPVLNGDPRRGQQVISRIGCGICHEIPRIEGARGRVGPSLAHFGGRNYIAGVAPNRPSLLAQFVRDAPSVAPETAMPELPISDQEARDVAAFLYTLR